MNKTLSIPDYGKIIHQYARRSHKFNSKILAVVICYGRAHYAVKVINMIAQATPNMPICLVSQGFTEEQIESVPDIFYHIGFSDKIGISGARNEGIRVAEEQGFEYVFHFDDDIQFTDTDGAIVFNPTLEKHLDFSLSLLNANPRIGAMKFVQRNVWFWNYCKVYKLKSSQEVTTHSNKNNLLRDWEGFFIRTPLVSNCFIQRMETIRDIGIFRRNFRPIQDVEWTLRAQLMGWETIANKAFYVEWPKIGNKNSTLGADGYRTRNELGFAQLNKQYSPLVEAPFSSKETPLLSMYPALIKAGEFSKKLKLKEPK